MLPTVTRKIKEGTQYAVFDSYHRRRAITNFLVLQLGQFNQNFGSRMFNIQHFQYRRAIICYCDVTNVINKHFIKPDRTQTSFDDVGN